MHSPTDPPMKQGQKRKNAEFYESVEKHPRKRVHRLSDDDLSLATPWMISESSNNASGTDKVDFNRLAPVTRRVHLNGSETQPDDIEWDPTINLQLNGLIGQPYSRMNPITASSSRIMSREINRRNKRKVSSNIRRKKMILWMLIDCFVLTWTGFVHILKRLYNENDNLFSMTIIKWRMITCLITESVLTGATLLAVVIKMKLMQNKCTGRYYNFITAFTNLHYLLTLLGLPFGIYFFFTDLSTKMRAELHGPSISWNITQLTRHCCGHQGRQDWKVEPTVVQDYDNEKEVEIRKEVKIEDTFYPRSCCNLTLLRDNDMECTESSKAYWTVGCHDKEFFAALDYFACILGLILIALLLSVMIRLWVDKLERYLTIFRPTEVFQKAI